MSIHLPSKIGKYDVAGLVGHGEVRLVFAAIDPQIYRRVSIWMFPGAFIPGADLRNFSRGAQLAASLQHPNIVKIHEVGVHEGSPYVVMEYLEGDGLDAALNDGCDLGLLEKISLMIQVCHGLAYAHRQGIPHYNLKPANVMLCRDGRIKIFDFGTVGGLSHAPTRRSEVTGGPIYLAPEQVKSGPVDYRADIFSAGVILYQLISNHFPFKGEAPASTILKIEQDSPPPLSTFLDAYPPGLEAILNRAMAKNPDNRYSSADEFASDLEHLYEHIKEDLLSRQMQKLLSPPDDEDALETHASVLLSTDLADQSAPDMGDSQLGFQQDEVSKPVLGLWVRAEKALADGLFEEAREHAEQALALDPDEADLQVLWETIRVEAAQTEKLQRILNIAQTAHMEGNLDAAKKAAEDAIEVAPNDAEAKAIYQLISRDILEGARQRQIEGDLKDARQVISSGKFNSAIEILRRAEELDPNAPGVRSLIQLALSGQQQELRRKEIEGLGSLIQDAINRGAYDSAIENAEEGLARFPQERALVSLKVQAKEQLLLAESKRNSEILRDVAKGSDEEANLHLTPDGAPSEVSALDAVLRRVNEEPDLNQSKIILQTALQKLPSHRQLQEKLAEVNQLDRLVSNAVSEAKNLEASGQYELALAKWEMIAVLHPRHPDLKIVLKRLRDLQQQARADSRQVWIDRIERALRTSDYQDASVLVETAAEEFPWDSDLMEIQERTESALRLRAKAQSMLAEAQKLLSRQQWEAGARKLIRANEIAPQDLIIRAQIIEGLSLASRDAMHRDRGVADAILQELAQIEPGAVSVGSPTGSQKRGLEFTSRGDPDAAADRLSEDKLEIIERQLAAIMGPVAKVLVTQAAAKTTSVKELYAILVPQLEQQEERTAFLAGRAELDRAHSEKPSSQPHIAANPYNTPQSSLPIEASGPLTPDTTEAIGGSQGEMRREEIFLPAGMLVDNARFTVIAPGSLPRGQTSGIQFWVHVGQQTETVLKRAREFCGLDDSNSTKPEELNPVRRGACLSVRLRLGDALKCVASHKWVQWNGDIGNANFVVAVPLEVPEGDLVCLASIRLNGCQVGKLSFLLRIGSSRSDSQVIPCQTVMHRRPFASYANLDRDQVLARVEDMETAYKGLRVYVDSVALRSATYWEADLHARIDAADVFYLFWCRHAMASDWVSREWRWALRSKGLDFIDPVPLESLEQASPPVELVAKDFKGPLLPFMALAGVDRNHI